MISVYNVNASVKSITPPTHPTPPKKIYVYIYHKEPQRCKSYESPIHFT